jgi:hypothetical protein
LSLTELSLHYQKRGEDTKKYTSTETYVIGLLFMGLGFFSSLTLFGIIVGIPMFAYGVYLLFKAGKVLRQEKAEQRAFEIDNTERTRKAIADGIAEGLKKVTESETISTISSKKETQK